MGSVSSPSEMVRLDLMGFDGPAVVFCLIGTINITASHIISAIQSIGRGWRIRVGRVGWDWREGWLSAKS